MDTKDVADQIREVAEERRDGATSRREQFQRRTALVIAFLAFLLAINSLGGDNAATEMVNANIQASDTWAFYQAKNIRQTSFRLAAEELELLLPALFPEQQGEAQRRIEGYKATVARYESEPDPTDPANPLKGEGKKELQTRARDWEAKREHAQRQDPNFDYGGALLQIAIVLGSVAVLATSRPVLALALALALVGTVLMLNGFFLWFDLPFG